MRFFVIYEFETEGKVGSLRPAHLSKWKLTGRSDDGITKQRKYVTESLLTTEQFVDFLDDADLAADTTRTMGSITETGWRPALLFTSATEYANAYVTPYPKGAPPDTGNDTEDAERQDERWLRLERVMLRVFGHRGGDRCWLLVGTKGE